ncbi:MAG: response regulator transcription factor [Elusimicrobia bacterium]|nr:response regulator transcription factor [Elusimicrobiota bacterium]MDE2510915.1 response regulator transcription factor [Elusimicrobiota bacterium]
MKLLIVEDDEDASSFMQYVLEDERHSVRTASAAGEARLQLRDFTPDLIILDRGLPDQDGLEFCRELKSDPRTARIPVMFVSSAKSPAEVSDGFSAGGDDYMTKPFSFVELIARVASLLRRVSPDASAHA